MKIKIVLGLLLASNMAFAQPKYYTEAAIGRSVVVDFCDTLSGCEDFDTAFKVSLGINSVAGDKVAAEFSYWDLGEVKALVVYGGLGSAGASVKATSLSAQLALSSPLNNNISLFGKAGFSYTDFSYYEYCSGCGIYSYRYSNSDNSFNPLFTVGVEIKANEKLSITGSVNNFFDVGNDDTGKSDVRVFNVGAKINF